MTGRFSEFKCNVCGRVFRLKSSLDVHLPIHKSDGVVQIRNIEADIASDNTSQSQESVLEFLNKGDPLLSCKHCGKHFTLHLFLKTHMIDCKQKSSYSKGREFSTEKFNFSVPINVSNEKLVSVNKLDNHSTDRKKAVNPFATTESLALEFSSCPVKSVKVTCGQKKNIKENSRTILKKILKVPNDSVKSVKKKVKKMKRDPPDLSAGDTVRKSRGHSKYKEKHERNSKEELLLCDMCGKGFSSKFKLSIHLKYHLSEFICPMCNKKFISQHALSKHITARSCSDEDKTCKYCSLKFAKKTNTQRHIRNVHLGMNKDVQCEFCGKMFNRSYYAAHCRTHTGEKPYICELCGNSYVQRNQLRVHLARHARQEYQCNICDITFASKKSLGMHLTEHKLKESQEDHGQKTVSNKTINCSHCNKSFPSITLLNHHKVIHHDIIKKINDIPYKKCSYCGKQFASSTHLKIHERIHTGEKPFKCSFCEKEFRLRHTLIIHKRTHTGERPFTCKECGKSFVQRAHLSSHLILHTGEKPYECSYCGKGFSNQSNLLAHKKLHLKRKIDIH